VKRFQFRIFLFYSVVVFSLFAVTMFAVQTAPRRSTAKLPESAYKLVTIKVSGSHRFAAEDVIAASGLRIGQTAHEDDFKQAAQELGESGAFSQVSYRYEYSPEGTELEFQVTDAQHFVPAEFDNLVWFDDGQLMQQLHARVPLFDGKLPLSGNLADQLNETLQALIAGKDIPAQVDYLRAAPNDGPVTAFVFSASGVNIHIGKVAFPDTGASELPLLQAAADPLQGQDYSRSMLRVQADKNFLPIYLARGYLKASFSEAHAKVVQESGNDATVDVSLQVTPGPQYKIAAVKWSGNSAFPSSQLMPLIHLQPGKPADADQLEDDLRAVTRLYQTKGYMAFQVVPVAQMDDAQATVSYDLKVQEGAVYHMEELEIRGLDSYTTSQLTLAWRLRSGDPYNASYPETFLQETSSMLPAGGWRSKVNQAVNKDKTVDVTIQFDSKGPELP
jgi:outer membrane protein assembly factor BamA